MPKKNPRASETAKTTPRRSAAPQPKPKPSAASRRPRPAETSENPSRHLLIVGIGTSAGGLEALRRFFVRLPRDSGLAFVLVPHLDAQNKSALVELLQQETPIHIVEAADSVAVRPDHAYVIPPNATMTIDGGCLKLASPRAHPLTIDPFLCSLAADQGDCAVGVILSGAGSDGVLGIRAIKDQGGFTLAQGGDGASHDSMPNAAIATGLVDLVVPVEEMPARLLDYANHLRRLRGYRDEDVFRDEVAPFLSKIYSILRNRTGHDFSRYKDRTFIRRVQRRMQVTRATSAADYVEILRQDAGEPGLLFKDLLIGVTQFFRDERAFSTLASEAIPKIVEGKGADDTVRIWVPGCATGEEAYSIAILLREQIAKMDAVPTVQIFATDLDAEALETARIGRYPETIARDVTPERLERFFVRDNGTYRVVAEIREMCIFSLHNLIKDAPFSRLDLISCRNLMIYLDASLQSRVVPLFHFALRDGGYLFLGSSENIAQHGALFSKVDAGHRLFRARAVRPARSAFDLPLSTTRPEEPGPRGGPSAAGGDSIGRRAMRVMEAYVPAYVVVDEHHDTLHFSGRTGKFLQPTAGTANLNLFNILDSKLRPDVRSALHRAAASGERTIQECQFVRAGGETQGLNIIVEPLQIADGMRNFVVIFQEVALSRPAGERVKARGLDLEYDRAIADLEAEVLATRERLHATIEELETANEEMKASNEEFQSVNEELQSSNEELETSKEELQSLNEELETVNTELNAKVESLERANNDRKNLLESTQIATVFLDNGLRIKSFTPALSEVFNLIDSDIGRPITDITSRLAYRDLEADVRKVTRTLERSEREVALTGEKGSGTYMMRILPYRTVDDVIDGVVITFVDISERKRGEEALARLASIAQTSHEAIIGLTEDARITAWNQGAERIYGYSAAEAIGQPLSLLISPERPDELRAIV